MKITIPVALCSVLSSCAVQDDVVSEVESHEVVLPGDIPTPQLDIRTIVDRAVGEPVVGTKRRYVGLSVLVIRNGAKYTFNYGQAVHRSGGGPPVTSDTLFAIGSVTKMFTGTLLARMQAEGRLFGSWNDKVSLYTGRTPATNAASITLLDLALHHGGLSKGTPHGEDHYKTGSYSGDVSALYDELDDCSSTQCQGRVPLVGGDGQYSNWAYATLAFAIASATARTVPAAFDEFLFTPLGMNDTGYKWQFAGAPCLAAGSTCGYTDYGNCAYTAACNYTFHPAAAVGYDSAAGTSPLRGGSAAEYGAGSNDYIKAGSGTLWSTPRDIMKWLAYNMDATSGAPTVLRNILPAIRQSRTTVDEYTLGAQYAETTGRGLRILRKSGWIPGMFDTYLAYTEDREVGVVVLSNYDPYNSAALAHELLDTLHD